MKLKQLSPDPRPAVPVQRKLLLRSLLVLLPPVPWRQVNVMKLEQLRPDRRPALAVPLQRKLLLLVVLLLPGAPRRPVKVLNVSPADPRPALAVPL